MAYHPNGQPQGSCSLRPRRRLRNDPDWQRGDYVKLPRGFLEGYQVLRMMIDGVPHLQAVISDTKAAEDFMAAAAKQSAESDPNDLLYSLEASQDYISSLAQSAWHQ